MDLKSNFSREWTAGVLFRMHRGVQPTIRLRSLIVGIRQVTVCRAGVSSLPWHLCPPRLHLRVEPQGTVRWRHAPLLGPLRQCRSKRKSLSPAASRRPPVGRRGHRKTAGFVDVFETAPLGPGRQPLNSRLPKNVIAWRLRAGKSSASVDQAAGIGGICFPSACGDCFHNALSGACSAFVLSACPPARKAVKPVIGFFRRDCGVSRRGGENTYIGDGRDEPAQSSKFQI